MLFRSQSIESLTGKSISDIQILGGGGRNSYLNQVTANASGRTARSGLTEATVVGNVLVQAIASGRFSSIVSAREHVRRNLELVSFVPRSPVDLDEASKRYLAIENKYLAEVNSL